MARHIDRPRSSLTWWTEIEDPHHHEIRLFPNYPDHPGRDPNHLLLQCRQRTTLGGVTLRLGRGELAELWRWLSGRLDGPLVRAVLSGGHADVLACWEVPTADGMDVGLSLTHRADEGWGRTILARLDVAQVEDLTAALGGWLGAALTQNTR